MFFDQLLQSVSGSKFFNQASKLTHQSSEKVSDMLDTQVISIGLVQHDYRIPYRVQTTQRAHSRKIDCFGLSEQKHLTAEELSQLRQERAQRAKLKLQQLEEERKRRKHERVMSQKRYQELFANTPLYIQYLESDRQNLKNTLEERKKKLEMIRNLHRPFQPNEFTEHQRRISEYTSSRQRVQIQKSYSPSFETSQFYIQMKQEQQESEQKAKQKKLLQIELAKKRVNYGEEVRVKFKPHTIVRPIVMTPKRQICSKQDQNTSYEVTSQETQLPQRRHFSESRVDDWQKLATSKVLDQKQKNEEIIKLARKLEQKAKKQEQLSRVKGEDSSDIDNLIVNSIKAKLTVLEN